jgi:hypothetical protein
MIKKLIAPLLFILLSAGLTHGQSTSVFDANYFDKDNTTPPIRVGKGFHINDVYKQTRTCFTPESSKQTNLSSQQSGGKKTNIKIFHTKTNLEFNSFRKRGTSGKISFLNLFSFGGSKLEEFANKDVTNEERIIFNANVDFGMFSFDTEPLLTEEAKGLIDQKKLQDFVKFFGTHYISGIRKESSISVILTKEEDLSDVSSIESDALNVGGKNPVGWKGSLEAQSTDKINTILSSGKFTAEIEIHGPTIEKSSLKGEISGILNGTSNDKADAIAKIIEGVLNNISDANQSIITQYYYSPFDLYGLDGVYWNEKKQNELTRINEAIINVYSHKTLTGEVISESGKKQYMNALKEQNLDEEDTKRFWAAYNKSIPAYTILNNKADEYLKQLEARYVKCADVYCANISTCCTNDALLQDIVKYDFQAKINKEEDKMLKSIEAVAKDVYAPECQKKKMGVINIENKSVNPYSLYQGDKFIQTIQGKETVTFTLALGEYEFKAVQDSGYLFSATVNYRNAVLSAICEEVNLKIGFLD